MQKGKSPQAKNEELDTVHPHFPDTDDLHSRELYSRRGRNCAPALGRTENMTPEAFAVFIRDYVAARHFDGSSQTACTWRPTHHTAIFSFCKVSRAGFASPQDDKRKN